MQLNIIFHYPRLLDYDSRSASGIRPIRMLEAFKQLGHNVEIVSGNADERSRKIKNIKKRVNDGFRYDFVYSESTTSPTVLLDRRKVHIRPFLDAGFFRYCHLHGIPVGLFYRDIYWRFEKHNKDRGLFKRFFREMLYYYDLICYQRYVDCLFIPSSAMGAHIPLIDRKKFSPLPPGHSVKANTNHSAILNNRPRVEMNGISIFYVGGVSKHYQMHKLFNVVKTFRPVELTVCTRKEEWEKVSNEYPDLPVNIKIVHEYGDKMDSLLRQSDIVSLFVEPDEYWEFAAPFKLYEYLGNCKPIIATEGTYAGEFVSENRIGWSIPYTEDGLRDLLNKLISAPDLMHTIKHNMPDVANENTWIARAERVIDKLSIV
jgi:glycosyltransferase involved in cell wall biosynthesis